MKFKLGLEHRYFAIGSKALPELKKLGFTFSVPPGVEMDGAPAIYVEGVPDITINSIGELLGFFGHPGFNVHWLHLTADTLTIGDITE